MYILFKDDIWGNKIPVMAATRPYADRMLNTCKDNITRVLYIPTNVQSIIKV